MGTHYPLDARGTPGATDLPESIALDLRITDLSAYRILTWALGRDADHHHTVKSIAHQFGMPELRVRNALKHLRTLGYVTMESTYQKGRQGMTADWTFHYPPLAVGDDSLPMADSSQSFDYQSLIVNERQSIDSSQSFDGQSLGGNPLSNEGVMSSGTLVRSSKEDINFLGGLKTFVRQTPPDPAPPTDLAATHEDPPPILANPGIVGTPSPTNGSVRPTMTRFQIVDDDPDDLDPHIPVKQPTVRKPRNTTGDDQFEQFWTIYERRGTKKQAVVQWKKSITRATPDEILEGARRYVASTPEVRYRKHAERWLRDDCWQDEVVSSTPSPTNGSSYVGWRNPTDPNAYAPIGRPFTRD